MSYLTRLLDANALALPADERRDVNQDLIREVLGGLGRGDFIPHDELLRWVSDVENHQPMTKAVVLDTAVYRAAYPADYEPRRRGHKSLLYVSDLALIGAAGPERWAERPGNGLEFLRFLAGQLDIVQAIIYTRQRQVGAFCRPYREDDNNPLGYRWVRVDGEKLDEGDQRATKRLDALLENCGNEADPIARRWDLRRKTFGAFCETLIADTLTGDACPIEVELSNSGKPAGWYNIPFETCRLAYEWGYDGDDRIVGVQVAPEHRVAVLGYERDELIFEVRNPRSDARYNGYGMSELEHFIRAGTSYLNTFTFNAASLDRNTMPRGFLTLYGRFDKRQLTAFKEQWQALLKGASRRWQLPVLTSESRQEGGATYTPVDQTNQEMFMTKWLVFLASLLCALYGMDPVEINMEAFTSKTSSLSGKDTSEKLQSSHDRGLIPLMLWLERLINDHLISRFTSKYQLTWVGLFPDDEERKHERQKLALTVNELRAIDGEDEHEDEDLGNAPANPSLMSVYNMKLQQKLMQAMPGAGAGGDDESQHFGLPDSERPLPYDRGDGRGPNGNGNGNGNAAPRPGAPGPALQGAQPKPGVPAKPAPFAKAADRLIVEIRDLGEGP